MERFELPDGWEWHHLGDVSHVMLGKTPKRAHYANNGIKVVKFRDVSSRGIDWNNDESGFASEAATDLRYLKHGDVLLTASAHNADSIGKKSCVVTDWPTKFDRVAFVGELLCARADTTRILPGWILSWFISEPGGVAVAEQVEGVHLTSGRAQEIEIPVPPLAEQRRLVARIETLTSRLEQARQARQAALAEAESAQAAARAAAFEGDDDWTDTMLGEVCTMKTGKTPPTKQPEYFGGDVPFVCPADVGGSLRITTAERTLTRRAVNDGKANLFPRGTVLLVGIGSTVGKVGLAAADVCTNQQITGLTFTNVEPEFAAWFLLSQRAVIENAASDGGVPIINQNGMGQLAFRYPPDRAEQRRIVSRLDALSAKQTELRRLQTETEAELAAFTPALLAKAFRGEL